MKPLGVGAGIGIAVGVVGVAAGVVAAVKTIFSHHSASGATPTTNGFRGPIAEVVVLGQHLETVHGTQLLGGHGFDSLEDAARAASSAVSRDRQDTNDHTTFAAGAIVIEGSDHKHYAVRVDSPLWGDTLGASLDTYVAEHVGATNDSDFNGPYLSHQLVPDAAVDGRIEGMVDGLGISYRF